MSVDTDLAIALKARLDEIEATEFKRFPMALPNETYNQVCGYLQCLRDVRDTLLPELVDEIQKR